MDPRHSRPFDVHRWSDHPEVSTLIDSNWAEHFSAYHGSELAKSGAKPKTRFRDQLRALILDLYVAWSTDPTLAVGVHLSHNEWHSTSRYNALHLSKVIVQFVHVLAEAGLIDLAKGSFSAPGAATNRTSRIWAAEPLKKLFREAKFRPLDVAAHSNRECIVLKAGEEDASETGKEMEYVDDDETVKMRERLRSYNRVLAKTFIDIPDLGTPYIERTVANGPRAGETVRLPIGPTNTFVRRVFNRGSFDYGGRFFGGWWQRVGSETRKKIHLNDQPTVEVDYQALHLGILAAESGVELDGDPYELAAGLVEGVTPRQQRKLIKSLILMALNAKTTEAAFRAFRQDGTAGSVAKSMTDQALSRLIDTCVAMHPFLTPAIGSDQGIRLMKIDSLMASMVINYFTMRKNPVLSVHDSFFIDYSMAKELKSVMNFASRRTLNREIPLSHNYISLDEAKDDPSRLDDYVAFRQVTCCPKYLARKRLFKEKELFLGTG